LRERVGERAFSASENLQEERALTRRASRDDLSRKRERCTEFAAANTL